MRLMSRGYSLMEGGHLSAAQWKNVRKHAAAFPSGRIDPTPMAEFSPNGEDCWLPPDKWTPAVARVVKYATEVSSALLHRQVPVRVLSSLSAGWAACWVDNGMVLNLGRLGHAFFDACLSAGGTWGPTEKLDALLLHELGHAFEGNHLSDDYHEALCALGARFAHLMRVRPDLFCC